MILEEIRKSARAEWTHGRLRDATVLIKNGTTATQGDEGVGAVKVTRIESISQGSVDYQRVGFVKYEPSLERYRLEVGDILLSHINSMAIIGNSALYDGEEALFSGMNLLRLKPARCIEPRWLMYWLKSEFVRDWIRSRANPAINQASISISAIKDLPVVWPDREEQRKTVKYLDNKITKLDELISKKQRLIEVVKEKRWALLERGVSVGVKADEGGARAETKDPIISYATTRWRPASLRRFIKLSSGDTPRKVEQGYPIYGANGVIGRSVKANCPPDVILIGRVGASGEVNRTKEEAWVSDNVLIVRALSEEIDSQYLEYLLRAMRLGELASKTAQPLIVQRDVLDRRFGLPSLPEQQQIVDYLDRKTAAMDAVIIKTQKSIEVLKEYRAALITVAVTGQIEIPGKDE